MNSTSKRGQHSQDSAADFLSRWSRRKHEARTESADPADSLASTTQAAEEPDAAMESVAPERELTDADMPDIESLTGESDFTPFMSRGVSDGLRRTALRKLFSQPAFNVTDGLNDYDEDYTKFTGLGNIVTHEMKRMLKRELEAMQAEPQPSDAAEPQSQGDNAAIAAEAPPDEATIGKTESIAADPDPVDPERGNAGSEDNAT